jgi:hypothetical protein
MNGTGTMSAQRWAGATLLVLVTTAVACSVQDPSASGVVGILVHGRVSTEADSSVSGARITLGWRPTSACTATFPVSDSGPSTDAGGLYGVLLVDTTAAETVCIKVIATPPAGSSLVTESTVVGGVGLSSALWNDSVRIDVVLPPL